MKGVIFDLDGVLVNSMPSHIKAWRQAFQDIAGIDVEKKVFYELEGMRGIELVEKLLKERNVSAKAGKVVEEKDAIFKEIKRPAAFPCVKAMIEGLEQAKAVVSGSSKRDVESVLEASIGKDLFDVLVTADDVKKGKPDPLAFNTALKKLQLKPGQAVVVENAPLGVKAANSAGMPCYVALNNTLLSRKDFAGLVPKGRVFEKTSSLKGLLQNAQ
ncbi:MAG: HAD family hydrolase [Nitrososphaera sp.]|uniref:HAD family hydrolase n=1 Tax=Nitrososphaera sp. TaxID=1971748 RepID=UPI003D6FE0D9